MFSTSADILNLILSVCITTLTILLSISIYYFISGFQKIHRVIKKVDTGVTKAEEVISLVKEKLKSGSAYLMVIAEIAKQAMDFAKKNNWSTKEEKGRPSKKK